MLKAPPIINDYKCSAATLIIPPFPFIKLLKNNDYLVTFHSNRQHTHWTTLVQTDLPLSG